MGNVWGKAGIKLVDIGSFPTGETASPGASPAFPESRAQVIPWWRKQFIDSLKPKSDFYPTSTGLIMITITLSYIYIMKKSSEGEDK
jgi:hypothetical protein